MAVEITSRVQACASVNVVGGPTFKGQGLAGVVRVSAGVYDCALDAALETPLSETTLIVTGRGDTGTITYTARLENETTVRVLSFGPGGPTDANAFDLTVKVGSTESASQDITAA